MQSLADLTVAILAGGFGTRLRPLVADRPKVLAEIRGRPFLAYLLDQVASVGVRSVVLCTGYRGDQVQSTFGDRYGKMRLVYSRESAPLGTAGTLRLALPLFASDPVLIMNGDSFYEGNLRAFWEWHCACSAEGTLLLTKTFDTKRYGLVQDDSEGRVISFDEKGGICGPGWINAGVYLLTRHLLLTIPPSGAISLEREMFPAWIRRGLYGYQSEGRFLDIGTPESYKTAEQFFAHWTLT